MGDSVKIAVKEKKPCIDVDLIPSKALYFMYYAGLSSFIPYKSIFQMQLGMSPEQNGVIQSVMQLVSLLSPPLAGIITDKTKKYRVILSVCLFFSVGFTIPFFFVPSVEYPGVVLPCCGNGFGNGTICHPSDSGMVVTKCKLMDADGISDDITVNATYTCENATAEAACEDITEEIFDITFIVLIVLTACMSFFLAPVTPLVDASSMDKLGKDRISEYGAQRLWGAVGFGLVGLGVSWVMDLVSPKEIYGDVGKNYLPAFVSAGLFWFITILVSCQINITSPKAKSVLKGVGKLLKKPKVLAFLIVIFMSGYSTGISYSYTFWYLKGLKGFSQTILGLSLLVTCCSEIPMFYISSWIIRKIGYVSVLSLGLIAIAVRFFVYTVITEAWEVLLIEWLHGISFALPFAAMCSYATVIAPKDAIATLMSLSQTVYWGLGNMVGALLGGFLYEKVGGKMMFIISALSCVVVSLIYWLLLGQPNLMSYCCDTSDEKDEKEEPDNNEHLLNAIEPV